MEHTSDDLNGSWDYFSRKYLLEESGAEANGLWVLFITICSLCATYYVWTWLSTGQIFFGLRNLVKYLDWVVKEMSDRDSSLQINKMQCKRLRMECELLRTECQRLSAQCQRLTNLWKALFARRDFFRQEFYCPVRKALKLVQGCCAENWLLEAVEFGNCREHFLEVLRDMHRSRILVRDRDIKDLMSKSSNLDETAVDADRKSDKAEILKKLVQCNFRDDHYLVEQLKEKPASSPAPDEITKHVKEFRIDTPYIYPAADSGANFTSATVIVFRVEHSSKSFVIKMRWRKDTAEEPQDMNQGPDLEFQNEANIMKQCHHPYAVGLVGYWEVASDYQKVPLLLMESMECNLKDLIRKRNEPRMLRNMWRGIRGFPALDAINLVLPVAKVLRRVHESGFAHRDIKPQNILITRVSAEEPHLADISVKLADFGSAQKVEGARSTIVGTTGYMDPDLLSIGKDVLYERDRLFKADVFSFGLVFSEVLTGEAPAEALHCMHESGCVHPKLFNATVREKGPPVPSDAPESVKSIIKRCCANNLEDRPLFEQICNDLQILNYRL